VNYILSRKAEEDIIFVYLHGFESLGWKDRRLDINLGQTSKTKMAGLLARPFWFCSLGLTLQQLQNLLWSRVGLCQNR